MRSTSCDLVVTEICLSCGRNGGLEEGVAAVDARAGNARERAIEGRRVAALVSGR
jgi:hypothetical protein